MIFIAIFIIISSLFTPLFATNTAEHQLVTFISDYITSHPRCRRLTIHSKMPERLSYTSIWLIRQLSSQFITLTINTSEFSNKSNSRRLNEVKRWLYLRPQRKSMNIILIDESYERDVEQAMIEHIQFLMDYSLRTTRPRCVFLLVGYRININLRPFFTFSWSHNYLDVVVIEIIKSIAPKGLFIPHGNSTTILFHEYNPFNDTIFYHTLLENLNSNKKLFNYKLNDLYGYVLRTGMFDEIPMVMIERNYAGNEVWGMAQGLDVIITRTLAERLNFTASVKVVYSDNPNLKRFNVTNDFMDRSLDAEHIDFAVNFYDMVGNKPLEDMVFESSIFLYPYSSNLIVKQHGKSVVQLSRNLIILTIVITAVIVAFSTLIRILRLDTKVWTTYNITKVLVGIPLLFDPARVSERILFMCLNAVSSAVSVNILEQLLNIYLWQDMFSEMNTLQDVISAGIIPSVTRNSKRMLSSYNNTALQQVLQFSTTITSEEVVDICIEDLINQKNVNGCEVTSILGKIVSRSFSDKERGWIINFVQEPIVQPCWTAMIVTKTSPYLEKFNLVLRRFSETGLIDHWYHTTLRNFTNIYKNFFSVEPLQYNNVRAKNRNYFVKNMKIPLDKKLIYILIVGHFVSCLVFGIEFIIGYINRRHVKSS